MLTKMATFCAIGPENISYVEPMLFIFYTQKAKIIGVKIYLSKYTCIFHVFIYIKT